MGAALFGKLPAHGDFVARGLPPGLRAPLDRWVSAHLAGRAPETWPEGGLRTTRALSGHSLTALILPSHDRAGRAFPLACCHLPGLGHAAAEAWCAAALGTATAASRGKMTADALQAALSALPPVDTTSPEPGVWTAGQAISDGVEDAALAAAFSSG